MLASIFWDEIHNREKNTLEYNNNQHSENNSPHSIGQDQELSNQKNELTQKEIFRKMEKNDIIECF